MKRILVPTDFTEYSEFAIESAVGLAKKSGGKIVLFHVLKRQESEEEALQQLENSEAKSYFQSVPHEHEICRGNEIEAITSAKADVIVMGSKGAQGLKSFFIGTNAERIAKHSDSPVITVKDKTDLGNIKSIVYPTDMRTEQELIMPYLKELQLFYGANLHLLKVYDDGVVQRRTVEDRLRNFAGKCELTDFSVSARTNINESDAIIEFAEEVHADMIAISTHDRMGIGSLVSGFISGGVINKAPIPIWSKTIPVENV